MGRRRRRRSKSIHGVQYSRSLTGTDIDDYSLQSLVKTLRTKETGYRC